MVDYFRQLRHLLPDALAWRAADVSVPEWRIGSGHKIGEQDLTIGPHAARRGLALWRFLKALTIVPRKAVYFVDKVFEDLWPSTTRQLAEWEAQWGLSSEGDEAARRLQLAAAWSATGGQTLAYLEGVLSAAGFPLHLHEWWESGPPYVARDPREHTNAPLIGDVQCSGLPGAARCSAITPARCSAFLVNEPGYLVNRDLTRRAPPLMPDDPHAWRFVLYLGAATFPDRVAIEATRRAELERLVLKHRPAQQWIVMLVDYV